MPRKTGSHHPYDTKESYFYHEAARRYNDIADDIDRIARSIDTETVSDRRIASLFSQIIGQRLNEEGLAPRGANLPRQIADHRWFDEHVYDAYRQGVVDAADVLEDAGVSHTPHSVETDQRHRQARQRIYRRQRRYWAALATDVQSEVEDLVSDTLSSGSATVADAKAATRDRLEHVGKYRARLIAETETSVAYNEALLAEYENAGIREVGVEKISWVTAGDTRVCADCAGMAGTYTLDEAKEMVRSGVMPHHPRCRCVFVPNS